MSVEVKEKFATRSMPLMDSVPFYAIFQSETNKQKRLRQLERALELFIEVLKTHEADEFLKETKIEEARLLLNEVIVARRIKLQGGKSELHVSALHKDYQNTVKHYVNTTAIEGFGKKFKELWENTAAAIANDSSDPPTASTANKLMRRIFSNALAETLKTPDRENEGIVALDIVNGPDRLGTSTQVDFQRFQRELAAQINNIDDIAPLEPVENRPTIRKMVSRTLVAALSKARNAVAVKSGQSGEATSNTFSEASSEFSGEGPGAASDIEDDFFTLQTSANETQTNNLKGQPSSSDQGTGGPLSAEEDIHPPRGSMEWRKTHRVQLSEAGGFRLIYGRSEMAARRESYNEEEDISPSPSVGRHRGSNANFDMPSSTRSLSVRDESSYDQRGSRRSFSSAGSGITGDVSFFSSEEQT